VNGITKPMKFINMHGKAGATPSDYQNRRLGYKELKDTLDAQFSTANLILLGDYNDVFNGTICGTCPTTISSVQDIITDSTDADSYKSKFSLHLAQQGLASTVSNPGMIDNVVVSNELENSLIPYSVERYSNVLNIITSYGSANTSDHFPIISRYSFNTVTSVGNITLSSEKLNAYPNPANGFAIITNLRKAKTSHIQVLDIMGKLVQQYQYRNTVQGQNFVLNTSQLAPGSYIIKLQNDNTIFVGRVVVQR
jgi:trimeric autotransporter adhesin